MLIVRSLSVIAAAGFLSGCALLSSLPTPVTTEERLETFPVTGLALERPVIVHWTKEQIPFIEAETDHDAAFTLGLVHAHLRLGQIEVLRLLSQGRLSEIGGPLPQVAEIEHVLRIIDLGKTSPEVYARMEPDSKAFLDAFVAGINRYQSTATVLPHDFSVLGIDPEPWRPEEILTIGRLASIDINWMTYIRLMALRDRPDWPAIWERALQAGATSAPSFEFGTDVAMQGLTDILASMPRTGSNSFAAGGTRTASRSAIIASDPHLGVNLPNMWLLAGLKSPSYNTVGFMVPGLPFVAVGRNQTIAWGGTNMHSAASDFIDVSSLPRDQISTRTEKVKVRWWFDRTLDVRETPYGPILSDAELIPARDGEEIALKWIGHLPSDEFSAMLKVNRAENWDDFRTALEQFAISPQNFVYADTNGDIGQVTATHLPRRDMAMPDDVVRPVSAAASWDTILTSRDLPQIHAPPEDFVATANNKPAESIIPIGYFFGGNDRVTRLRDILSQARGLTVDDMKALQRDTYMTSSARMKEILVRRANTISGLPAPAAAALSLIADWDSRYDADSKGAVAFEATMAVLIPQLADDLERQIITTAGSEYDRYALLLEQANGAIDVELAAALTFAAEAVATYPTWGDMHRLSLEHAFGLIPLIGGKYRFGDMPWPGSTETLWRADHGLSSEQQNTRFGSQARHISDMSDLDSNWFVLLGGNDGWINSENFLDQAERFRTGDMIQIPLRIENVRAQFPLKTILRP